MDENIIEILEKIKTVCENQGTDCESCPFGSTQGDCLIQENAPNEWQINKQPLIKYLK